MKLHEELLVLRKRERQLCHLIIEKLQSVEDQRLYLQLGYNSLFDYLVRGLGYSESAAYLKQSCVRLGREIPEVHQKLSSGELTASSLSMAFKTLKTKSTDEKKEILSRMENQPSREVKKILAEINPDPVPIKIEKTEYQTKVILRLELTHRQNRKLERLKALKSHQGDLSQLLERIIDKELAAYENTKFKTTRSKNPRFVSKTLRNQLLAKADYKCEFPGCRSAHFLQIDHRVPVSKGGLAQPENLQVLCSAHNQMKGNSQVDL